MISALEKRRKLIIENQMARRNLNKIATLLLEDERKKIIARQNKKRQIRKPVDKNSVPPILGERSKDREQETNRQLSDATGIAHGTIAKFNYVQKNAEDFDEGDLIRQMCEETVDDENRKMTIARAYNKIKQKERQEELRHKGFPLNKYEVIYVDSKANNWDLVKRHPVSEIAKHNATLFLWAISHEVEQGLKMMEHWNFKFDNCVVWNFVEPEECRGVEITHDILLIGTRGAFYDFCPHEKGVLLPGIHCKPREEGQEKRARRNANCLNAKLADLAGVSTDKGFRYKEILEHGTTEDIAEVELEKIAAGVLYSCNST